MTDWTSGYVADIDYTYGYYPELNPLRLRLAFLHSGLRLPEEGAACELGFGQGVSVNMHAAASMREWVGTDFNPAQAGFAREISEVSGANIRLFDEAFEDFCCRSDLPNFDFIGLHGIWSWISDANRAVIVDFVKRKLKVGGVLYISYNTLPGWAATVPLRHLLTEHAEVMAAPGRGIVSRIDAALDFTEKLLNTNAAFGRDNPGAVERIKGMKEQNRSYLAHEYFNRDWLPMHFADMANWLAPAKVEYACSANFLDHVPEINLSVEQKSFLAEIPDPHFRETVRDFMVNQQFRKDYWVKGARKLTTLERSEALRQQKIILLTPRTKVSLKVNGSLGEATLNELVYDPILDHLAHHKVSSLAQIEQAVKGKGVTFGQILQAVMILTGAGHVAPVQDEVAIGKARKHTDRLNTYLMDKARSSNDIAFMASPLIGAGFEIGRFEQLFLLALSQGRKQPDDWANFVWTILHGQNQKILKEGKTLQSPEENLAELKELVSVFAEKKLPIVKALHIV